MAGQREYEVTITDLTSGQPLTPPVVAMLNAKHPVFDVGQPASVGVREIAENGNSAPLLAFLEGGPAEPVLGVRGVEHLVPAGVPGDEMFDQSAALTVNGSRRANRLSFVSMLICTNDGFTGVDGLKLPVKVGQA